MKKSIISLAVAAMALITPAIISAADNGDNKTTTACPRTECVANGNTNVKPQRPCPFDGLNLTDAQKKQIEDLGCPFTKANKDRKAQKSQNAPSTQQAPSSKREQRANYLAQIKNILTSEQYVKFLENQYLDKAPRHGKHDKFARGGKHGKRHHHAANRPKAPKA